MTEAMLEAPGIFKGSAVVTVDVSNVKDANELKQQLLGSVPMEIKASIDRDGLRLEMFSEKFQKWTRVDAIQGSTKDQLSSDPKLRLVEESELGEANLIAECTERLRKLESRLGLAAEAKDASSGFDLLASPSKVTRNNGMMSTPSLSSTQHHAIPMARAASTGRLESQNANLKDLAALCMKVQTICDSFGIKCESTDPGLVEADLIADMAEQLQNSTAGGQAKEEHHEETSLVPCLQQFPLLADSVKDFNNKALRTAETMLMNDPENPRAHAALVDITSKMETRYKEVIEERCKQDGRTFKFIEVARAGNDAFKEVYDSVWFNTVANAEEESLKKYTILMQEMGEKTKNPSVKKQPQTKLLELYIDAAKTKPAFDGMMRKVAEMFQKKTGRKLELSLCPLLKKTSRIVEKASMRGGATGNVSGVKDVVRAMITGRSMDDVNIAIEIILKLHNQSMEVATNNELKGDHSGVKMITNVEICRKKDRFLEAPSAGGWRDLMVNINIKVTHEDGSITDHLTEVQVAHHQMLNARKGLSGHAVYNRVRNAMELMAFSRGSIDVASIADFVRDLKEPKFHNWLTDKHVREWAGVTKCTDEGDVLEVDFEKLDPLLQVRHHLPNVNQFSFPISWCGSITNTYIENMAKDYQFRHGLHLDISSRTDVSDDMLGIIGENEVLWKELDISQCLAVTEAGLVKLADGCPNLNLRLSFYDHVEEVEKDRFSIGAKVYTQNIKALKINLENSKMDFTDNEVLRVLEKHNADVEAAHADFPVFQALSRMRDRGRTDIIRKWFEAIDGDGTDDGLLNLKYRDGLDTRLTNEDYQSLVTLLASSDGEKIVTIDVSDNLVEGSLPPSFGSMAALKSLRMSNNKLSGVIPKELAQCGALTELWLNNNAFTGTIPSDVGQLKSLVILRLDHNELTGSIPGRLGECLRLKVLNLSFNKLSSGLPFQLGNLSVLETLHLHFNKLTGSIPANYGQLKALTTLNVSRNKLSGALPNEIGSCSGLVVLILSENAFNGPIPPEVANLTNMTTFEVRLNFLEGSIPPGFGQMPQLRRLNLGANRLTGTIPSALGDMKGVKELVLYGNLLDGEIPEALQNLKLLEELNIGYNQLTGKVPNQALGKCLNLTSLNLVFNRLTDPDPELTELRKTLPQCKTFV